MAADVIANRYRILREVGRGGMGVVYHAQHTNTGESVALKVLLAHTGAQADMLERFKREMRAPALIRSEHVVRVTDADVAPELGGALFLVMELLNGSDLERVLQKRCQVVGPRRVGVSPVGEIVRVQVCVGARHRILIKEAHVRVGGCDLPHVCSNGLVV